jgi:hypothetical protein
MAWNYSNTSVQTTISAPIAPGDTTIAIADTTGLPVSFPFSLILDYQLATVEVVTVTNVVALNLTVTRGQDGTSAQAHSAGGPVVHGVVARDVQEPQNHIAATTNIHGTGVGAAVVGTTTAQTLTTKTISGASNSLSNIADASIIALAASKLTGNFGAIVVNRTLVTDPAIDTQITGDTVPRLRVTADGKQSWGPGGAGALDTFQFRDSGGVLRTSGDFKADGRLLAGKPTVNALTTTLSGNVTNTTTETAVIAWTIPANDAAAQNMWRLNISGACDITGTPILTLTLRLGGVAGVLLASLGFTGVANTDRPFDVDADLRCVTTGAGATWHGFIKSANQIATAAGSGNSIVSTDSTTSAVTRDSTVNQDVVITAKWSVAAVGNSFKPHSGSVVKMA